MSVKFDEIYNLNKHSVVTSFTSPSNMTSSGTLGGDSFAVSRYYVPNGLSTYRWEGDETNSLHMYLAFDSSSSTFCYVKTTSTKHGYFFVYSPNPFNIESMTIKMRSSSYSLRDFMLQYSDDNVSYTDIERFSTTATSTWNITVTPYEGYHKYYRFEIYTAGSADSTAQMTNIVLIGTQLVEL